MHCQAVFDQLKCKLTESSILSYPDFTVPSILQADASDTAVGGILSQSHGGRETAFCYWNRHLTKPERSYP